MKAASDVTLQINVCAGDLAYGDQTVRALVETHRADVAETLIVADCCRPQTTPYLDAEKRFPPGPFAEGVARLRVLCDGWKASGLVQRVVYLEADRQAIRELNRVHCGRATSCSHDHLGHAFSAYFTGWQHARTRYIVHFDADIFLHQEPGFTWVRAAVDALQSDPGILAVSPRIAPPLGRPDEGVMVRTHETGSGWLPTWRLDRSELGWQSDWFSTRCHVMDLERYRATLPLTPRRGVASDRVAFITNAVASPLYRLGPLARLAQRAGRRLAPPFPLPPEVLLHERAASAGLRSLYLGDARAWYLHPDTKPDAFFRILPRLLDATAKGDCPPSQRGISGIRFEAWEAV